MWVLVSPISSNEYCVAVVHENGGVKLTKTLEDRVRRKLDCDPPPLATRNCKCLKSQMPILHLALQI
jgi:hypothetical protein